MPFCGCNKQERANNVPAFLFKTANSIPDFCNQVANYSQAFLTATVPLVFHCSVWIDSLLTHWVNTSESAGMILWITEIKWSAGMNHLIWFSYNRDSRRESEAKRENQTKKEEKTKNAEVGKSSPAKETRKLKTMRNCWNDNISLAGRVCLYKQERENLQSLWDFIRLSLSIQQHSHASMFTIQCSEWNISVLYTVFIWNCKYHKTLF